MNLFVIRHAIAVDAEDPEYNEDSERPLTEKGRDKMKRIAHGLGKLDIQPDVLLTSPAMRTMETAQLLADGLGMKKKRIIPTGNLISDGRADQLIEEINQNHAAAENIALVGHEPYLSSLVSVLISGNDESSLIFKKGGVCLLSVDALEYGKCATLNWLLTPAQLIRIGKDG